MDCFQICINRIFESAIISVFICFGQIIDEFVLVFRLLRHEKIWENEGLLCRSCLLFSSLVFYDVFPHNHTKHFVKLLISLPFDANLYLK